MDFKAFTTIGFAFTLTFAPLILFSEEKTDQADGLAMKASQAVFENKPEKAARLYRQAWQLSLKTNDSQRTAIYFEEYRTVIKTNHLFAGNLPPEGPTSALSYVESLQEKVKIADNHALAGSSLLTNGDAEGATEQFEKALSILPNGPMTEQRRSAYKKRYSSAACILAKQYADGGRLNDCLRLLGEVLRPTVSPNHKDAIQLLTQLSASPYLTKANHELITKINDAMAAGQTLLNGEVPELSDRYDSRVMHRVQHQANGSTVEPHRMNYYDVSRDQTRTKFLREVAVNWELPTPDEPST